MIFATKKCNHRDGELLLVHPNRQLAVSLKEIVPSLRECLEDWDTYIQDIANLDRQLRSLAISNTINLGSVELESCLPRTWLFVDGSSFIHHIKLVRKARKAEPPPTLLTRPLLYQAESGKFLSPTDGIPQSSFSHGTDFEGEVGVIISDTPMGVSSAEALKSIKLITLINDVSLRGLIPEELSMGFGFFNSKPQKSLSPFALTPDELFPYWIDGRLNLPLYVNLNGHFFGKANAGEMHFHFGEIISQAAKTRPLVAGTLIGSGTVSNEDASVGSSCIVEQRTIEQIETGEAKTPYLKNGDRVEIWMEHPETKTSLFGKINQVVKSL